jgi:ATP-dependent DNA ligase
MAWTRRNGIMLAYPFEEKRLNKWPTPYIVQPKLDGDRCRVIFDADGRVTLLSSEENEIVSVPHINKALEEYDFNHMELDGELYTHGAAHQDIRSVVGRTVNIHPDSEMMQLHLFDVVNQDVQAKRLLELKENVPESEYIKIVRSDLANNVNEIIEILQEYEEQGYEGVIVRHIGFPYLRKRSTGMMKWKPRRSDYYTITGYEEEISIHGEKKGTLGALWLTSDNGERFKVGSGSFLTRYNRTTLWPDREKLIGMIAHIKYQHLTERTVPRFPVLINIT